MTTLVPTVCPRLRGRGTQLILAGWLLAAAAIVTGIVLATHSFAVTTHIPNPLGGSPFAITTSVHPFVALGIALIIGGILQAMLFSAVGHIAHGLFALLNPQERPATIPLHEQHGMSGYYRMSGYCGQYEGNPSPPGSEAAQIAP
jgi:hypothetical protein